jgi:hypothetical protein
VKVAANTAKAGEELKNFLRRLETERLYKEAGRSRMNREDHVRLCVQVRLVCSAGVSPVRVRIRSPVAQLITIA